MCRGCQEDALTSRFGRNQLRGSARRDRSHLDRHAALLPPLDNRRQKARQPVALSGTARLWRDLNKSNPVRLQPIAVHLDWACTPRLRQAAQGIKTATRSTYPHGRAIRNISQCPQARRTAWGSRTSALASASALCSFRVAGCSHRDSKRVPPPSWSSRLSRVARIGRVHVNRLQEFSLSQDPAGHSIPAVHTASPPRARNHRLRTWGGVDRPMAMHHAREAKA